MTRLNLPRAVEYYSIKFHSQLSQIRNGIVCAVLLHDAAMAALSAALFKGIDGGAAQIPTSGLPPTTAPLIFAAVSVPVFYRLRIHKLIWRHISARDIPTLAAASALTVSISAGLCLFIGAPMGDALSFLISVFLHWVVFTFLLISSRIGWMWINSQCMRPPAVHLVSQPVVLVGSGIECSLLLRGIEAAASPALRVVGILDGTREHFGRSIRGVPVLGTITDLGRAVKGLEENGQRPEQIIVTSQLPAPDLLELMRDAERLGLATSEVGSPVETRSTFRKGFLPTAPITLQVLVGRRPLQLDPGTISHLISGKRVLVTGAGGSIGRQLAGLISQLGPQTLAMLDNSEFNLWQVDAEIGHQFPSVPRTAWLRDIRSADRMEEVFAAVQPDIVFHAAALKHVPMVESNPAEGVLSNVAGSRIVAECALKFGARAMVQVSTDKAVNSTSVMGMTKRLAEFYCQALDLDGDGDGVGASTRFLTVRFGNVLGSSGSVVPVFQKQIEDGGPVTITHPEMTRYFMTIGEACELVLHAAAHGLCDSPERGMIYVLDMGKPIQIIDLARQLILLNGKRPERDIPIKHVGLRQGEKLVEELFDMIELRVTIPVEGVLAARSDAVPLCDIRRTIGDLERIAESGDEPALLASLVQAVQKYSRKAKAPRDRAAA